MAAHGQLQVVLYGREGCHLCDEAEAMLARIAKRVPLTVRVIDIDADDYLQRIYMMEIPVVTVEGVEIARAPISETTLEDALVEQAKQREPGRR
ncbi:MAG: glutaredoxin family protein [Tepidiformaceae bacterium]